MDKYYTYAYLRDDRTPYYIGKGITNRAYLKHRRKKGSHNPPPKERILILKTNLTEDEAFKHEKYMIAVFGRKDLGTGILYNFTDGGQGSSGRKHSDYTKQKIKDKRKHQIISDETKEKMSASKKGRKHSNETKEKMSLSMIGKNKGKVRSLEHRRSISERQFNKSSKYTYKIIHPDGVIEISDNLSKFCRKYNDLKLDNSALLKVAKQIYTHHKGFKVFII